MFTEPFASFAFFFQFCFNLHFVSLILHVFCSCIVNIAGVIQSLWHHLLTSPNRHYVLPKNLYQNNFQWRCCCDLIGVIMMDHKTENLRPEYIWLVPNSIDSNWPNKSLTLVAILSYFPIFIILYLLVMMVNVAKLQMGSRQGIFVVINCVSQAGGRPVSSQAIGSASLPVDCQLLNSVGRVRQRTRRQPNPKWWSRMRIVWTRAGVDIYFRGVLVLKLSPS